MIRQETRITITNARVCSSLDSEVKWEQAEWHCGCRVHPRCLAGRAPDGLVLCTHDACQGVGLLRVWLLFRALTGLGLARPKGPDGSISQKLGQLLAEPPSASATSLFRASDDGHIRSDYSSKDGAQSSVLLSPVDMRVGAVLGSWMVS